MTRTQKYLPLIAIVIPLALCLIATIVKFLLYSCGRGEWTGLGEMPWGAAFFFVLAFGSGGACSRS